MTESYSILMVKGSPAWQNPLREHLKSEGFISMLAETTYEAIQLFEDQQPNLILMNVELADTNGFQFVELIRSYSNIPLIIICDLPDAKDEVKWLNEGADDYISKPFDILAVTARIKANLRRAPIYKRNSGERAIDVNSDLLKFDRLTINLHNYEVKIEGNSIILATKELQLLLFMVQNVEKLFTPEELYAKVWGVNSHGDLRTVMVHISNLRKKIERNPQNPQLLVNVRGFGYKFSGGISAEKQVIR